MLLNLGLKEAGAGATMLHSVHLDSGMEAKSVVEDGHVRRNLSYESSLI